MSKESDSDYAERICQALPQGAVYTAEDLGSGRIQGKDLDALGERFGVTRLGEDPPLFKQFLKTDPIPGYGFRVWLFAREAPRESIPQEFRNLLNTHSCWGGVDASYYMKHVPQELLGDMALENCYVVSWEFPRKDRAWVLETLTKFGYSEMSAEHRSRVSF